MIRKHCCDDDIESHIGSYVRDDRIIRVEIVIERYHGEFLVQGIMIGDIYIGPIYHGDHWDLFKTVIEYVDNNGIDGLIDNEDNVSPMFHELLDKIVA